TVPPSRPPPVRVTVMRQDWERPTFLHWRFDAGAVQSLVPPPLSVERFDGSAWVSLVLFRMRVHPPAGPVVPWMGVFPETNLRTYVRGPDGGRGIWFLSVEAGRLAPTVAARAVLGLPYHWASMTLREAGGAIR